MDGSDFEDSLRARLDEVMQREDVDLSALIDLHQRTIASLGPDNPLAWELAWQRAEYMARAGQADEALIVVDAALARAVLVEDQGPAATQLLEKKAAILSHHLDRDAEATPLWGQAQLQWQQMGADGAEGTAERALAALAEKAQTQAWSGDFTNSVNTMGLVLDQADSVWGPHADQTLGTLQFQIETLRRSGRHAEALEVGRRLLARVHATGKSDPVGVMDIRRGIALDLREVDGPGEALETLRALHQDAVEELGATHPTTLDLEEEVAFTQGLVGNGIACDAAYRELLPRLNSPVDTPLIEAASRRWINVLREQDPPEPELLENALRDRVDIRVTEFGPQSVETLQARGEWGEHLANTGRDSDAMAVFEEMRAQVTDGGVDALLIDHSRALILCRRHHFADAVELLRSTLSAAEKTQESVSVGGQDPDQVPPQTSIAAAPGMDGPELPEVIRDVRRTLTLALTDMGEMDEAAQIFREDNAEDVTAAERADKLSRAEDLLARHRNVKAALELQELLMEIEPELGEHHPIVHQAHHLQSQAIRRGRKRIWLTAGAAALLVAAVVALIVVL